MWGARARRGGLVAGAVVKTEQIFVELWDVGTHSQVRCAALRCGAVAPLPRYLCVPSSDLWTVRGTVRCRPSMVVSALRALRRAARAVGGR
jgi:hypothetical protein